MIPMLFLRPAFGAYGRKSEGEGEGKEKERKKKKERRKMCGERNGRWTYLGGGNTKIREERERERNGSGCGKLEDRGRLYFILMAP